MENIIEKSKFIVNLAHEKVIAIILIIIDFLKNNLVEFFNFLFNRNIIQTGVGIILASQISRITNVIVESLINPIVKRLSMGIVNDLTKWEVNLFDIKIKIGLILSTILNFILISIVVYYIWKLSQNANFNFIKEILEDSKKNINTTKTKVVINVPA